MNDFYCKEQKVGRGELATSPGVGMRVVSGVRQTKADNALDMYLNGGQLCDPGFSVAQGIQPTYSLLGCSLRENGGSKEIKAIIITSS